MRTECCKIKQGHWYTCLQPVKSVLKRCHWECSEHLIHHADQLQWGVSIRRRGQTVLLENFFLFQQSVSQELRSSPAATQVWVWWAGLPVRRGGQWILKDRKALLSLLSLHREHFSSSLPPFLQVCLKNECLREEGGNFYLISSKYFIFKFFLFYAKI